MINKINRFLDYFPNIKLIMSSPENSVSMKRIQRLIRDLDLRYIRGSIDRRTYQTLKNKYLQMLENSAPTAAIKEDRKTLAETKKLLPQLETNMHKIQPLPQVQEKTTQLAEEPILDQVQKPSEEPEAKLETMTDELPLPLFDFSDLPSIEIEELQIRYVMRLAIKSATKAFEEEVEFEQQYLSGKLDDEEYLKIKNDIELKSNRIFEHFYKLSDLLFSISQEHLFKRTHNNFLLYNNELSENISRLRRNEVTKNELKGIIYDINERVLKHRPILIKAVQDTKKWKKTIAREIENILNFKEANKKRISGKQLEALDRKIRQIHIYEELLDEDIHDYNNDLEATNVIYGEHLLYQEITTPYFNDLSSDNIEKIQKYGEVGSTLHYKPSLDILSSTETSQLDYSLISELKSYWNLTGHPVIDEQKDLVGFLVGPGFHKQNFGIIVNQQHEISLSMIRRIYDYIISPRLPSATISPEEHQELSKQSELQKKIYLLNELPRVIPNISFTHLIPDTILEYCKRSDIKLSDELRTVLLQPENNLFVPIEFIKKSPREVNVESNKIVQAGSLLPFFDPTTNINISSHILKNENVKVKDIFGNELGIGHSIISHPGKGYFLVVLKEFISNEFYAKLYDIVYGETKIITNEKEKLPVEEKKWRLIFNLSREYNISEGKIEDPEFLKKVMIEKNTGVLPEDIENAKFVLYSLGNVRILSNTLQINFGAPCFELSNIFELEGKIVENVQGKEIGVVYTLQILEKTILYLWTSIDLLLIASFVSDNPHKLLSTDENFIDNLAISIGKHMSVAPQTALRPDNVMTFFNLIGKISSYEQMKEIMNNFKPTQIEFSRIISVEKRKILVDISEEELLEINSTDESSSSQEDVEQYVTSPEYYLKDNYTE